MQRRLQAGRLQIRPHHLLGRFHTEFAVTAECLGDGKCLVERRFDEARHQTQPQRFVGVDGPGGQDQIEGRPGADQPRQRVTDADVAAAEAEFDELGAESGRRARDPQVAGQRDAESTTVGDAVDGCDHRLAQPVDLGGEVGDAFLPAHPRTGELGAAAGLGGVGSAQVQAGTEASAGAGQHDDAAGVVRGEGVECLVQLFDQLIRQRVELLGPVEGQDGDLGSGMAGLQDGRHGRHVNCCATPPRRS